MDKSSEAAGKGAPALAAEVFSYDNGEDTQRRPVCKNPSMPLPSGDTARTNRFSEIGGARESAPVRSSAIDISTSSNAMISHNLEALAVDVRLI